MSTIDRLRELERAATEGPWEHYHDAVLTVADVPFKETLTHGCQPDDAAAIAAARNALPALLDVAEAARAVARALMSHEVGYFPGSDAPYYVYTEADRAGWNALRAALARLEAIEP